MRANHHGNLGAGSRRGFTLVEMLVSTALVLMILLIFAQIYRSATTTLVQQRGIAQNDARARMVATILRGDLLNATYQEVTSSTSYGVAPSTPYDVAAMGYASVDYTHPSQRGYLYISENDVDNDIDDVLQFTVQISSTTRGRDDHPYLGKASQLGRPSSASSGVGAFDPDDVNQPEYDDGNPSNGATQSRAAEVVYFVRRGTLYRRVLLLRDPLPAPVEFTEKPSMGQNGQGGLLIEDDGTYDNVADAQASGTDGRDFWNDFDLSAIYKWNDSNGDNVRDPAPTDSYELHFNGLKHLDPLISPNLGIPEYRFGFVSDKSLNSHHRPREYTTGPTDSTTPNREFIGRYLHEETSHADFRWPGEEPPAAAHPYRRTLALNNRGVATAYAGGPRAGEDILLPNVDAFDVKVWDPGVNRFVDLGYAPLPTDPPTGGYFSHFQNFRKDYGPRAVSLGADGQPGAAGVDDDGDGTTDNDTEIGWPGTDDVINRVFDTWNISNSPLDQPVDTYAADNASSPYDTMNGGPGTRFMPAFRPLHSRGPNYVGATPARAVLTSWPADTAVNAGDMLFPNGNIYATLGYLCTTGGMTGSTSPNWPTAFNRTISDGEVVWQSIDNRVGVMLLQITIRYRDPASNLSRQLTIQHSFTNGAR